MTTTLPLLQPTVPGYANGIICADPLTVQCSHCGVTATPPANRTTRQIQLLVMHWGFMFHHPCHQGRLCPKCRYHSMRACERTECSRDADTYAWRVWEYEAVHGVQRAGFDYPEATA